MNRTLSWARLIFNKLQVLDSSAGRDAVDLPMAMTRPNVLLILSDQHRWDTLGCYGQRLDVTPNLDRLAETGVRFENAFTCQPVCGPARACLQTGTYASEVGCNINGVPLPEGEITLPRLLSAVGYDVGYVGKWHLGSNDAEYHQTGTPLVRRGGFDGHWVAAEVPEFTCHSYGGRLFDRDMNPVTFDKYRVDAFTDFALDYLAQRDSSSPFFLFLSYVEPHPQSYRKTHYHGPPPGRTARDTSHECASAFLRTRGGVENVQSCQGPVLAGQARRLLQFPQFFVHEPTQLIEGDPALLRQHIQRVEAGPIMRADEVHE